MKFIFSALGTTTLVTGLTIAFMISLIGFFDVYILPTIKTGPSSFQDTHSRQVAPQLNILDMEGFNMTIASTGK